MGGGDVPYQSVSYRDLAAQKWTALGQIMCHMADILIFSDVISDARPLLQGNCSTPIILQVTNRFDVGVQDRDAYLELMHSVALRPNVFWVFNNPYDELYVRMRGIKLPESRTRMLRPVGMCLLPAPPAPHGDDRGSRIAHISHGGSDHLENTFLKPWILRQNLEEHVTWYDRQYGGPAVLAQHRGVLQVPYQVSVMKMYEGLAAGAVFIVPSASFFQQLLRTLNETDMFFCCRELLDRYPDSWTDYTEWYSPEFREAFIYYNSWEQLKEIILGSVAFSPELYARKRVVAQQSMQRSVRKTLTGYSEMYGEARRKACDDARAADVWSGGYVGNLLRQWSDPDPEGGAIDVE